MQAVHQPLKRHIALRPLSHEHHDTLLFVWKIRQGVTKNISLDRLANYCSWYWHTHLQNHMRLEEIALTNIFPAGNQLIKNMLDDHGAIKMKMEQVIEEPTYSSITRLAQILNYHVRFEERILFPAIENIASADQLDTISQLLEDRESHPEWHDSFWIPQASKAA